MNIVNELCRCDKVLIKYMKQVKLYDEDFRILDRYRGYLEIVRENNLNLDGRMSSLLFHKLFKKDELKVFVNDSNDIINGLRKYAIDKYIHKED